MENVPANPVDIKIEQNLEEAVHEEQNAVNFMQMQSNNKSMCPQCGAEVLDLKQHIKRVHNKKPETEILVCPDCGKKCTNKNQLTLHWSYVHKVVDNLFCNLCAKSCTNMAKLRQHTLICIAKLKKIKENAGETQSEPMKPKPEDSVSNNLSQIRQDLPAFPISLKKFACNLCRKPFSKMAKLKKHTQRCLPQYLKQDLDDLSDDENPENNAYSDNETSDAGDSDEDLPNKELKSLLSREQNLNCPECGESCSGIGSLIKHRMKCFSERKVKDADINQTKVEDEKQVEKIEPVCDLVIKEEVEDNAEGWDPTQNTSGWQHSFDFLKIGNQKMQVAKPNAVKKKYDGNSGKHVACQLCPKILANKKNLKEHVLRRHSEHKTVVCEYCAKDFKSTNIKNHIKEMHINFIETKCPTCEKVFPKRKSMLDHVRTVHAEEKGVCDICCKTFENRTYLQRHIRTAHSNSDLMYTCHHCLKQYKSNALLRNHIRIVHIVNNVECGICGKVYKNKLLLGKHERKYHRIPQVPKEHEQDQEQAYRRIPQIPQERLKELEQTYFKVPQIQQEHEQEKEQKQHMIPQISKEHEQAYHRIPQEKEQKHHMIPHILKEHEQAYHRIPQIPQGHEQENEQKHHRIPQIPQELDQDFEQKYHRIPQIPQEQKYNMIPQMPQDLRIPQIPKDHNNSCNF